MLMLIPLILLPPVVILLFRHFGQLHRTVTAKEVAVLILLETFLLAGGFYIAKWNAMSDTEYWNGRVSGKPEGTQGCCHCRTVCDSHDKKGNCTSSHRVCDHFHDYWWALDFTTGDRITVKSCSGSRNSPARWDAAQIGDPAAIPHTYTNYLLADPESVYNQSDLATTFGAQVPKYPEGFDLHYINRAFSIGTTAFDASYWNGLLMEMNADLDTKDRKDVNVIIIATNYATREAAMSVSHEWLYGKMNDAIFVIGAPDGDKIEWAELITAPGTNEAFKTQVRHGMDGVLLSDTSTLYDRVENLTRENWKWTGIEEFAYLASAAEPGIVATVILYILGILGAVGGTIFLDKHSLFGDEEGGRSDSYRNRRYGTYTY